MNGTKWYGYKQYENKEKKYGKYISAEFDIKLDNENIRIINSYEHFMKEHNYEYLEKEYENEEEIKKCEIEINNILIPFSYFYKFQKKGKFKLKYTFKNNIKNVAYMFWGCSSLTYIDLSNFNTQNVTDMSYMFFGCNSLIKLNFVNSY